MMQDDLPSRLRAAARDCDGQPLSLERLLDLHGQAAPGTLLVLLAAPCVLPVPGVGNVLGAALLLLALGLWRRQTVQLPPQVAGLCLPGSWSARVLRFLATLHELAARLLRQRWQALAQPAARGWLAPKVATMGAVISLPLPLGNLLPALALVLLGLGLARRDGLAVLLALAVGAAGLAYAAAFGAAAWAWGVEPAWQAVTGWL